MDYDELPRGYIRGFYVQHILDNPAPKTVSQIITIALKNKRLWLNPDKVENIPTKPKTIALKYTEDGGKTFYDYEVVRIGEYLWMNSNFYNPVMNMPTGGEFDVMLGRYGIPASSYPMDMQVSNRYFGQYYNRDYMERMAVAGKMQEAENSETSVTLYPNPVSSTLYLKSADQIQSVTIYNISGGLVFTKKGNLEDIDVSGLSGGVYFIKVKTHTGTHSHKFIKNK